MQESTSSVWRALWCWEALEATAGYALLVASVDLGWWQTLGFVAGLILVHRSAAFFHGAGGGVSGGLR